VVDKVLMPPNDRATSEYNTPIWLKLKEAFGVVEEIEKL